MHMLEEYINVIQQSRADGQQEELEYSENIGYVNHIRSILNNAKVCIVLNICLCVGIA